MSEQSPNDDERFYMHMLTLLSVSAGMVGVCLTAVGLVGIVKSLGKFETFVDDLLAVGTTLFMAVCMLSFLGMRTSLGKTWRSLTATADIVFCAGLVVLVAASMILTWALV
jgi:hypothetical protein